MQITQAACHVYRKQGRKSPKVKPPNDVMFFLLLYFMYSMSVRSDHWNDQGMGSILGQRLSRSVLSLRCCLRNHPARLGYGYKYTYT